MAFSCDNPGCKNTTSIYAPSLEYCTKECAVAHLEAVRAEERERIAALVEDSCEPPLGPRLAAAIRSGGGVGERFRGGPLMAAKDISDLQVVEAFCTAKETGEWPYEILMNWTGQPQKVCYAAMDRASRRGLVDYGVSLRSGWLTEKGWGILEEARAK